MDTEQTKKEYTYEELVELHQDGKINWVQFIELNDDDRPEWEDWLERHNLDRTDENALEFLRQVEEGELW